MYVMRLLTGRKLFAECLESQSAIDNPAADSHPETSSVAFPFIAT